MSSHPAKNYTNYTFQQHTNGTSLMRTSLMTPLIASSPQNIPQTTTPIINRLVVLPQVSSSSLQQIRPSKTKPSAESCSPPPIEPLITRANRITNPHVSMMMSSISSTPPPPDPLLLPPPTPLPVTPFSAKYFLKTWDQAPHGVRMKLLTVFVESCKGVASKELEIRLKADYMLVFTRILGYFQLSYLHGKDLLIQLKSLGLFIQGYKPMIDFLEAGGTQILLEILGFNYYKEEVEDKMECLTLLHQISSNGRKFKEIICFDNGLPLLRNAIVTLPHHDCILIAKNLFLSLIHGNTQYGEQIINLLFETLISLSPKNNWSNLVSGTSIQSPTAAATSTTKKFADLFEFAPIPSSSISPRVMSLITPRGTTTITSSPFELASPTKTPNDISSFTSPLLNSVVLSDVSSPMTNNEELTSPKRKIMVKLTDRLKSKTEERNEVTLSSQSILLIYELFRELSKTIKLEQFRETKLLDILFTNMSDEDAMIMRGSVSILKLALSLTDENEIFTEMVAHRCINGISIISMVLVRKRFKYLLKHYFGSRQSKQEMNYSKNFQNLICGICTILNSIVKSRNIYQLIMDNHMAMLVVEAILVLKEKYGELNYMTDAVREMANLFRTLLLSEYNNPNRIMDNTGALILEQLLTKLIDESHVMTLMDASEPIDSNMCLFIQDAIQRSSFDMVRKSQQYQ